VLAIFWNKKWPKNNSSEVPAPFCCAILLNKEQPENNSSKVLALNVLCYLIK
jgi:hypothetical protein